MKYKAILFDLDGTLLPMDNDEFTRGYFGLLSAHLAPRGYQPKEFIGAMWKGVAAMITNDGSCLNGDRFWSVFSGLMGEHVYGDIPFFDDFYRNEFHSAVAFCQPTPLAVAAVEQAREKAGKVVLATNPFFPLVAVEARLSWTGIKTEDFDLVTHYGNSRYCKPSPEYYIEIAKELSVEPRECLMIGNNAKEDVWAAQMAGMNAFLLTDCLICDGEIPDCPQGSFEGLLEFLKRL